MRPDSHLRSEPPPADPAAAAAVRELATRLRADLDAALAAEPAPSYEELEAYVDGRMDADEAEAFDARIADDPLLAAEVEDLIRLQSRLSRARRPARVRWAWAAAAALVLTVAGTLADRMAWRQPGIQSAQNASATAPTRAAEPIFTDGFESGDAAAWQD